MTKKTLAREVGKNVGLSQVVVRGVMDRIFTAISNSLARGERVELRNFGVFKTGTVRERVMKNPKTGKAIHIPARTAVRFKPGKELKRRVA